MHIYCVYPSITKFKKSTTTATFTEKNRNNRRPNHVQLCPLSFSR